MGRINQAGELPRLDSFPTDINWREFDTELAFDVLGFPARIEAAQAECYRVAWEMDDFWKSEVEAVALGSAAWNLAVAVRRRYKLGSNELLKDAVGLLNDRAIRNARTLGGLQAQFKDKVSEEALAAEVARRGL